MPRTPSPPWRAGTRAPTGAVALFAVALLIPSMVGPFSSGVGAGFLTTDPLQHVSGSFGWGGICPSDQWQAKCQWSSGFAFLPGTGQVVMTTSQAQATNDLSPTTNGYNFSLVFNGTSELRFDASNLSCASADPYYPGSGKFVYIPCNPPETYSNAGSVTILDVSTDRVVNQIPVDGWWVDWSHSPEVLAWDSQNGLLYACHGSRLLGLDLAAKSEVVNASMPGGCAWLVYDAASDSLLVSGAQRDVLGVGLRAVDPRTGQIVSTPVAGQVTTGVVNSREGWIALGISSPTDPSVASIEVVNATTYAPIWTVDLPPPGDGRVAAAPIQLLLDPAHGDLYDVSWENLVAVNLTTHAVLTTIGLPADFLPFSAIYVPSTDSVYVTKNGLATTVSLSHTESPEVTSLLWLPASAGLVVLATIAGSILATLSYARGSRRRKRRRSGSDGRSAR
jgi:hypothetical protein